MTYLVVLDFDGTFTNVEEEGAPFLDRYREEFASMIGRDVRKIWAEAEQGLQDPELGWNIQGRIVAPANCDPYIRATVTAFAVCDRLDLLPTLEVRTGMLQVLYSYAYRFTETSLRPDASATIERLKATGAAIRVVTNSDPDSVKKKLASIGVSDIPVFGNAKKYFVDPTAEVTAHLADIQIPGLKRPLLVRRPYYMQLLQQIWAETGSNAASTLVCGDIFELDLLLPLAVGAHGHQLIRPNMLSYEKEALASFGARATGSSELIALADRVEAWCRR